MIHMTYKPCQKLTGTGCFSKFVQSMQLMAGEWKMTRRLRTQFVVQFLLFVRSLMNYFYIIFKFNANTPKNHQGNSLKQNYQTVSAQFQLFCSGMLSCCTVLCSLIHFTIGESVVPVLIIDSILSTASFRNFKITSIFHS